VVSSLVQAGSVSVGQVSNDHLRGDCAFLGGSIIDRALAGAGAFSRHGWRSSTAGHSMLFALVLASGLFLAWLAHAIGLAPIIGAFAAGLLFEPVYLKALRDAASWCRISRRYCCPKAKAGIGERMRSILREAYAPPARAHGRADRLFLRAGVLRAHRHAGRPAHAG
jgi:hypothetical protein